MTHLPRAVHYVAHAPIGYLARFAVPAAADDVYSWETIQPCRKEIGTNGVLHGSGLLPDPWSTPFVPTFLLAEQPFDPTSRFMS